MHHKVRELLVAQRTQLINALRGHLAEIGVIAAQGLKNARELTRVILAEGDETIPACVRAALAPLVRHAHAVLYHRKPHDDALRSFAKKLMQSKPFKLVAVALANKMARIAFAIMRGRTSYCAVSA